MDEFNNGTISLVEGSDGLPGWQEYKQFILDNTAANNAWSANQAASQNAFQERQNAIAMDFNAAEAAKVRDWEKMMSDTAHQREMADLKAAGLNPILAAGKGAAVTSAPAASGVTSAGAKGETDTSGNQALTGFLASLTSAMASIQNTMVSAQASMAAADKMAAAQSLVAQITQQGAMDRLTTELGWKEAHPNNWFQVVPTILAAMGFDTSSGSGLGKSLWNNLWQWKTVPQSNGTSVKSSGNSITGKIFSTSGKF